MRKRNKFLIGLIVTTLGAAPPLLADDFIVINTLSSGKANKINIENINNISFLDDKMIIDSTDGLLTVELDDIDNIGFALATNATDEVSVDLSEDIHIDIRQSVMTITGAPETDIQVAVYDLKGFIHYQATVKDSITIDFNNYNEGIYIIKANNKLIKFKK